eukprot:scaffold14948_cov60-Phaeocystis_antarctica.AAC.4
MRAGGLTGAHDPPRVTFAGGSCDAGPASPAREPDSGVRTRRPLTNEPGTAHECGGGGAWRWRRVKGRDGAYGGRTRAQRSRRRRRASRMRVGGG